jgi:hypothetical protein
MSGAKPVPENQPDRYLDSGLDWRERTGVCYERCPWQRPGTRPPGAASRKTRDEDLRAVSSELEPLEHEVEVDAVS